MGAIRQKQNRVEDVLGKVRRRKIYLVNLKLLIKQGGTQLCVSPFVLLRVEMRIWFINFYRITRMVKAVVCGGILMVIKDAWCTRTRIPGVRHEKFIGRPKRSNTLTFSGTLKRIEEERF